MLTRQVTHATHRLCRTKIKRDSIKTQFSVVDLYTHYKRMGYVIISKQHFSIREGINCHCRSFDWLLSLLFAVFARHDSVFCIYACASGLCSNAQVCICKCGTLDLRSAFFPGNSTPTQPLVTLNNVEPYTFVTLFSGKFDTTPRQSALRNT